MADIDENSIKKYLRKAETSDRLPDVDGLTTEELLEKLRLAENGKLKRAAIVLFGKDPGKFYPNTFVKIGKFEDDDFTIRFQEVEEGNVIGLLEKVLRTLYYKFLIKNISFEGMNRVETLEYPVPALREMLLNALIHRNYMGAPTQIKAVFYVKEKGKITNAEYQQLNGISRQTASNDLSEVVDKYLIFSNNGVCAGSFYEFVK